MFGGSSSFSQSLDDEQPNHPLSLGSPGAVSFEGSDHEAFGHLGCGFVGVVLRLFRQLGR
jgi:hypothetical protein